MGMYDELRCKYPLPLAGANELLFQTKDTDSQYLDMYEIREDGTLWHSDYDIRNEMTDEAPLGLWQHRDNERWQQEKTTGEIRFYTGTGYVSGKGYDRWIEFSAYFIDGKLKHITQISPKPSDDSDS